MQIDLKQINGFHLEATNQDGLTLTMDASPGIGGTNKGMRPTEVLLSAVAGCSSIDVILILQKQKQQISNYNVTVIGNRFEEGDAKPFKNITIQYKINGVVDADKANRAAELSLSKYCSVSKNLEGVSKINFEVILNGKKI